MKFSLRTLLVFVFIIAVAIVSTQYYLGIRNSRPIDDVIAEFNEEHFDDYKTYVNDGQSPLGTSKQFLEYINSYIEELKQDEQERTGLTLPVFTLLQKVVSTKRIPKKNVRFVYMPYYEEKLGEVGRVIEMQILSEDVVHRIEIRKIQTASFTPDPQ